jgi:peroxiredoxin
MDDLSPNEMKQPPQVGQKAPDFVLIDNDSQNFHLSEITDVPVILVFFSETLSDFSIQLAASFKKLHESLCSIGTVFLGIVAEPTPTLKTFIEEEGIPFRLLSDFDRKVSEEYGVLADSIDGLTLVAKPSVFVINSEGVLVYRWIGETHEILPNIEEVANAVLKSCGSVD